eukprot:CAMPEP_0119220932 /NCGR_PEP_ID=MMETSP1327-20130426/27096_1 /TAXON_ID=38833 /ORGANISM="Micromonas pusilla, Strain RCC2306" /LENGTH=86 /DNA_ID=CAMNT_0007219077 /DNA_START=327 /DNA_END=583 /DNA_ORIENTATION=-
MRSNARSARPTRKTTTSSLEDLPSLDETFPDPGRVCSPAPPGIGRNTSCVRVYRNADTSAALAKGRETHQERGDRGVEDDVAKTDT